jgi:uncharacterized membrane protein YfcA
MLESLSQALQTPGLIWLFAAIGFAGLVRGFTGFGTALIFVPVAGRFLPPEQVIATMAITGVLSSATLFPRAWKTADRAETGILVLAAFVTIPIGLWLLTLLDVLTVRWSVAAISSITLAAIVTGWQWRGQLKTLGRVAIGAVAGLVSGLTGLTGPIVIMFYLTNARSAQAVRSNTILFLGALDIALVANLAAQSKIDVSNVALAIILAVPYLTLTLIGQSLFDPSKERTYRVVAYCVIMLAVITGLPLLD